MKLWKKGLACMIGAALLAALAAGTALALSLIHIFYYL